MTETDQEFCECTDCHARVPAQDGDPRLVSVKYGWRLLRREGEGGQLEPEWRCPTCWKLHRKRLWRDGGTPSRP